ncbi:TonB-dependent receptor [Ferrimonas aestuarii]|uniref:TonB-dependent receptor n=1 Tax=Ferrimonas aestuarii TaxID=2569539 RepID=A0A4U1BNV6_9GAMM|nr:TonB-dependent receptor [Ferrimonas aestuarii]TKB51779.1 TonB-dependent receptor [Ferrimonas aestuarii]
MFRFRAGLSPLLLAMAATGFASPSWSAGRIDGIIKDADSQLPLQGAIVRIEELQLEQSAARDGRFNFPQVEAGDYTLTVSYLGAKPQQLKVTVLDDKVASAQIDLTGLTERIEVLGQRGSLSRSLNQQRAADNLVSVVSADAIGQFPDTNVSEALQRVPGVSIERDQGEGRFVRVRGMAPDYNAVSMNGARLPAPEDDRRAVALDVIPSDLLETLEVTKTLTPDMDADSLGGAIEVKSLSAFDRDDTYVNMSAEGSYDSLTENTNPKLAASYSDRFNDDTLGVALAASWYDRDFGSDNVETGGKWDFDESPALLEEAEQRDYQISRERIGLGANFDYRPSDDVDFFLRTLYSDYNDDEVRNANVIEWADPIASGDSTDAEVARELKQRTEEQSIYSAVLGGQWRPELWTLDYQASWSQAKADKPRYIDGAKFEGEFENIGFTDTETPHISAPDAFFDASEYELDKVELGENHTEDTVISAKVDFTRDLSLRDNPAEIKFGGKYSTREKTADETVWVYEDFEDQGISGDDLNMSHFAGGEVDYNLGRFGPSIQAAGIWNLVNGLSSDDALDEVESTINDYRIDEDLMAAYLMGTMDIGELRVLGGVRYERLERDTKGYGYNDIEERFDPISTSSDNDHWLPSLHFKYSLSDKTQLRASWSNTLVRPTFGQLAPGFFIEEDDGDMEASFGNPNLEPLESMNWDIGIEHYLGGVGVLSANLYYKDIKNFIYEADLGGYGAYTDFNKAQTFINGDDAYIYGAELAYVQEFTFLPDPFKGLLFSTNFTLSDSEATIDWFDDDQLMSRDIPLPSQSELTANASLGYENSYVSLRLSAAYKSEYLVEVDSLDDANHDIYEDEHLQWDFVAKGFITSDVIVYFKAINLTDEPFYTYTGNRSYNAQYEEYGRTFQLGIQYNNF